MNPGDSSWWWTHAFDAVAGGLVTAGAVLLTLWWERRRGGDTELHDAMAAVESLLWQTADPRDTNWRSSAVRLSLALPSAATAAQRSVPALIPDLSDAAIVLSEMIDAKDSGQEPTLAQLSAYHVGLQHVIMLWRRDLRRYQPLKDRELFRPREGGPPEGLVIRG